MSKSRKFKMSINNKCVNWASFAFIYKKYDILWRLIGPLLSGIEYNNRVSLKSRKLRCALVKYADNFKNSLKFILSFDSN